MPTQERATAAYVQKLCLFSRDVRLYLTNAALVGFCWMGIYGVLFNLYLLRLDYDLPFIGLVNAVAMLAYAVFSLPGGALGGRWGVRRIMILGFCLAVAGLALPPLAEAIPTAWRQVWLLLTYSLGFLGAAVYIVNADVYLMGATSPTERSYAFSVQVALWPLAAFAGSLIGGFLPRLFGALSGASLDAPDPYRYSLLVAAVLAILGVFPLLATGHVATGDAEQTVSGAGSAPYGLIAFLALVQLLQGAGEGAARTFFNVYLDGELQVATPLIGTLAAVGQLAGRPYLCEGLIRHHAQPVAVGVCPPLGGRRLESGGCDSYGLGLAPRIRAIQNGNSIPSLASPVEWRLQHGIRFELGRYGPGRSLHRGQPRLQ